VHENRRKASYRLAKSLISFYRVPLTKTIISLFVEHFGADEEALTMLNREESHLSASAAPALPSAPITIKPWSQLFNVH